MDKIRHGLDLSHEEADKVFEQLENELGITNEDIDNYEDDEDRQETGGDSDE